jgi:fatty acyl-CoA reductase
MIMRPSVVSPTLCDPFPGWVNSYLGIAGFMIAIAKGIIRTMYCNESFHGDFLPVDIATHSMMLGTWVFVGLK